MHDWIPKKTYANLRGVKEPSHIKIALEMQYWMHCELYPHQRSFDTAIHRELCGLVTHANAELITSDTSLAPFESAELSKMMDIMRVLQGWLLQPSHFERLCWPLLIDWRGFDWTSQRPPLLCSGSIHVYIFFNVLVTLP